MYKVFESLGHDLGVKPVLEPDNCETFEKYEHNFISHHYDGGFLGPKKLWLDEFRDGGDAYDSDGDSEEFPRFGEWQRRRNVSYVGEYFTEFTYIDVEEARMHEWNDRREVSNGLSLLPSHAFPSLLHFLHKYIRFQKVNTDGLYVSCSSASLEKLAI